MGFSILCKDYGQVSSTKLRTDHKCIALGISEREQNYERKKQKIHNRKLEDGDTLLSDYLVCVPAIDIPSSLDFLDGQRASCI